MSGLTRSRSASGASLRHKLKPGGAKGESEMSSRGASPSKGSSRASWIDTSAPMVTASRKETRNAEV